MKPILAATIESASQIAFPVLASPKLDGIRCLIRDGKAYSRNLKLIPNKYIQSMLAGLPDFDGELVVGSATAPDCFNKSSSGVMSVEGSPDFTFHVFDVWSKDAGFADRLASVQTANAFVTVVEHTLISTADHLAAYEQAMLLFGYEGVMVRSVEGIYKHGRSTVREGYLGKIKQFTDAEAEVIGMVEQMHNTNEQTRDELGRSKRSSAKAGMVGKDVLGALLVRDLVTGVEFEIGTGFNDDDRQKIWCDTDTVGRIVKYKHQPVGAVDKPRFPVFLGFRDIRDF